MKRRGNRFAVALGVGLALVPLLLIAYLGLQMRPRGDDYQYLALPLKIGTWETFLHWRGIRHSFYSNFLAHGLLAPLGASAPALYSVALLALIFAAYSWVANTALAGLRLGGPRRAIAMALAALMAAGTFHGLYAPHSFFWYASSVEYMLPVPIFLLGIALAVEAGRRLRGKFQHGLALMAAAVYAFFTGGFAETYLLFQMTALALIAVFISVYPSNSRRRLHLNLTLAAGMGSLASLALQVSAPGFANRAAAEVEVVFWLLPAQELVGLVLRSLDRTLAYVGHEEGFAAFMLVAFAGMFATLSSRVPVAAARARSPADPRAPLAFVLGAQLLFVPILWAHRSDSIQLLGRFSFGYALVVSINLLAIAAILALIWRRDKLDEALKSGAGLTMFCGGLLALVCLLFALTQARGIHYKASSYLFITVLTLLLALGSLLARAVDEPKLKRRHWLCAFATAGAIIALATLIAVEVVIVRYIANRTLAAVSFALTLAGLFHGVALGALIGRAYSLRDSKAAGLRWLRLLCLLAALTIWAGLVIAKGRRVSHIRADAELWDAQHQEIIRLRDAGDPRVYTMEVKGAILGKFDHIPLEYAYKRLTWKHKLFYGLDDEDAYS